MFLGAHVFREKLTDMEGGNLEDRLKQLVKQIDTDNSGTISSEELAFLDSQILPVSQCTETAVRDVSF
jgi:hypothetical protein